MQKYICTVDTFAGLSRILSELSFRQESVCTDVLVQECVTRVQVILVLSGTEVMHTYLTLFSTLKSHSSLFSSLSGPQAGPSTTSLPYIRRHQRANLCGRNFGCASLIGFVSRFVSAVRSSGVLVEHLRSLDLRWIACLGTEVS